MLPQSQISHLLDDTAPFDPSKTSTLCSLLTLLSSPTPSQITYANQILTTLKQSPSLFLNTPSILTLTLHPPTILYLLLTFEQQLPSHWPLLSTPQRSSLLSYYQSLLPTILPTDQPPKTTINTRIKTILVKMYILNHTEPDPFIPNLIEIAQGDQWKCENILDMFAIMVDEAPTYGTSYIAPYLPQILTLAAMVLRTTQETKIKNNLIKCALTVLEQYCRICPHILLPTDILIALLDIFQKNKFRIQICSLLSLICGQSPEILRGISPVVFNVMDWGNSVEEYRKKVKGKGDGELLYVDMFLRALGGLAGKMVEGYVEMKGEGEEEGLRGCYRVILCLSESEDKDTWVVCRQAWITYVRLNRNLLDIEELSTRIIFKCEVPSELLELPQDSPPTCQPSSQQQFSPEHQRQDSLAFSTLVSHLAHLYPSNMYQRIWQFIESQTFVKFSPAKFTSCTYALCYLHESLTDPDQIMNIMKLLMNISESVETQWKKIVVVQFLNVFSFYTKVVRGNEVLRRVLEEKYLENVEECVRGFGGYCRAVGVTEEGRGKVVEKVRGWGAEKVGLQEDLWEIVLREEGVARDERIGEAEGMGMGVDECLAVAVRGCAGLKVFGLDWAMRWDIVLKIVDLVNNYKMQVLNQGGQVQNHVEKRYVRKIQQVLVRMCEQYCYLCLKETVNVKNNVLLCRVVEGVAQWEGYQKLASYFA